MNRDKYGRTVLLTALAAMLALVLAGCGGDDGISESVHDQVALERDQAQQDLMDAEAERDQVQQDLTDAEAERDQAQQDLMDTEAERDQAQQDLMDAEDRADAAEQDNQDMMDDAGMQQAMADSAAARELLNRALANPFITVGNFDGINTFPDYSPLRLSVTSSPDGTLMARVVRDTSSGTRSSGHGIVMTDMTPDPIEGWRGATLVANADSIAAYNGTGHLATPGDTIVVYSDRGSSDLMSLQDRYYSLRPTATMPRRWAVGNLSFQGDARANDPAGGNYIPWDAVTRPDAVHTLSGPSTDPVVMFEGAVHGIPGTFACNAADAGLCTVPSTQSDGTLDFLATAPYTSRDVAWTFVPDDSSATFTDFAADTDYLIFGWWLDKGADGLPDFVRVFADALGEWAIDDRNQASTSGANLRGTATYKGAAAGKYALASDTADVYEGGHFTAMATLMVDFDADLTPASDANDRAGVALSGMIDNFMTGSTSRPDWTVKLMADLNPGTDGIQPLGTLVNGFGGNADSRSLTTEWSTGGAQMGTGTWDPDWWDGVVGGDIDAASNTAHPLAVTGTFNAHIGGDGTWNDGAVGRIQGGFGANKMMDE